MIFHLIFMVLYMTTINTFLIDYTVYFSKFLLLGKIDNRGSRYCRWQKKTLSENQQNSNQTRKRKTSTNNCWIGWLHQSTHRNSSKPRHSVHRQKWESLQENLHQTSCTSTWVWVLRRLSISSWSDLFAIKSKWISLMMFLWIIWWFWWLVFRMKVMNIFRLL